MQITIDNLEGIISANTYLPKQRKTPISHRLQYVFYHHVVRYYSYYNYILSYVEKKNRNRAAGR